MNYLKPEHPGGDIALYQTEDGRSRISVRLSDDTAWLSLNQIAELFQTTKPNVSMHIRNIFNEGELRPEATAKQYLTVQTEGTRRVQRDIEYYNLDVIISVGYRVRSHRGTQFRIWATERLRELSIIRHLESTLIPCPSPNNMRGGLLVYNPSSSSRFAFCQVIFSKTSCAILPSSCAAWR